MAGTMLANGSAYHQDEVENRAIFVYQTKKECSCHSLSLNSHLHCIAFRQEKVSMHGKQNRCREMYVFIRERRIRTRQKGKAGNKFM